MTRQNTDDAPSASYELDDLLEQMSVEAFPEVVELGPAVGEEVW